MPEKLHIKSFDTTIVNPKQDDNQAPSLSDYVTLTFQPEKNNIQEKSDQPKSASDLQLNNELKLELVGNWLGNHRTELEADAAGFVTKDKLEKALISQTFSSAEDARMLDFLNKDFDFLSTSEPKTGLLPSYLRIPTSGIPTEKTEFDKIASGMSSSDKASEYRAQADLRFGAALGITAGGYIGKLFDKPLLGSIAGGIVAGAVGYAAGKFKYYQFEKDSFKNFELDLSIAIEG